MTTQATQSNNALGRRSLPSTLFAPLQTLGRYMDRQKDDGHGPEGESGQDDTAGAQAGGRLVAGGQDLDGRFSEELRTEEDDDAASWREWSGGPGSSPGKTPDPEAVRGAISRLAQGAQWQSPQAGQEPGVPASLASARTETAGFAEVARRVWGDAVPEPPVPRRVVQEREGPGQETRAAQPFVDAPDAPEQFRGLAVRPAADTGPAASIENGLDTSSQPDSETRQGSAEAHALAHDASNLLSALRLYSELLCFSGVLHERHRHYAEDLKLLSQRSERLIDRLLRLAEQVAVAEYADNAVYQAPASHEAPRNSPLNAAFGAASRAHLVSPLSAAFKTSPHEDTALIQPVAALAQPAAALAQPVTAAPSRTWSALSPRPGPELVEADGPADSEGTTLANVLMRMRGVLGTLAHGALVVDLGPRAGVPVGVPEEALERILVNLVSNAAAAVRDGGAIRIRAGMGGGAPNPNAGPDAPNPALNSAPNSAPNSALDPTVVLTVDDSGCGMSEAQLQSALGHTSYDARGQSSGPGAATAPDGRRHGLGLSIVRELVRMHGGTTFIHSRPGTGTRIEIHWPAEGFAMDGQATSVATVDGRQRPVLSPVRHSGPSPVPPRRNAVFSLDGTVPGGRQQPESASAAKGAVA